MSKYSPDHSHLFFGVVPTHVQARHGAIAKSFVVGLKRVSDDHRARFAIDQRAVAELAIAVGDRLLCTLEFHDGEIAFAVDVYAVHDAGFVDVRGYEPFDSGTPRRVRLQRFTQLGRESAKRVE